MCKCSLCKKEPKTLFRIIHEENTFDPPSHLSEQGLLSLCFDDLILYFCNECMHKFLKNNKKKLGYSKIKRFFNKNE